MSFIWCYRSLGLAITPRLRFLKKVKKEQEEKEKQKTQTNVSKLENKKSPVSNLDSESHGDSDSDKETNSDKETESDNSNSGSDISRSENSDTALANTDKNRESFKFDVGDSDDELFSVRKNVTLDESEENKVRKYSLVFPKIPNFLLY